MRENKQTTNGDRKRYKTVMKLKYRNSCVFYKYTQQHINSLLLFGRTKPENKKGYQIVLCVLQHNSKEEKKKQHWSGSVRNISGFIK